MGGRGASSGMSVKGKEYGTEYTTLHKSGNIKFVRYNDSVLSKTPMETMTKRRIYVTVTQNNELKAITLYDDKGKRKAQIDLSGRPHKVNGNFELPHKHNGYLHDENGTERLNKEEQALVEKVKRIWYSRNG